MCQEQFSITSHPEYNQLKISGNDVADLVQIVDVFTFYYQATVELSGSDYPTLSIVHPLFYRLIAHMRPGTNDKPLTKVLKAALIHYTEFYIKKYIMPRDNW